MPSSKNAGAEHSVRFDLVYPLSPLVALTVPIRMGPNLGAWPTCRPSLFTVATRAVTFSKVITSVCYYLLLVGFENRVLLRRNTVSLCGTHDPSRNSGARATEAPH